MSRFPSPLTPAAEQGTTLIELLVAMVTAIVVLGALVAILDFSLNQESRTADKVQADQIGRISMSTIIQELHSSCTGFGATAIQAPSTTPVAPLHSTNALNLWFLSSYGNASSGEALLTGVTEHDIKWTSTKTSNTGQPLGTLTDYAFPSTPGGRSPTWVFGELTTVTAKARVLATNVIPPTISSESTIFQYYKDNNKGEFLVLTPAELPTATANNEVAEVTIGFTQAAESGDTRLGRTASLSDSVVLRFNSSQAGSEVVNAPCA